MTFSKVLRSPFGTRLWLQQPLYRSGRARSIAGASSASSGGIKFASQQNRLNEDNMSAHHQSTEIPPQEWTMFNDKLAVLQDAVNADEEKEKWTQTYAGEIPRMSVLMELADKVGVLHDVLRCVMLLYVCIIVCLLASQQYAASCSIVTINLTHYFPLQVLLEV
jgi:hypothetical protein